MSKLDDYLGIESLDDNIADKNSEYAYIAYLEPIEITDVNSKGELVQFNRASLEDQIDLIPARQLEKLSEQFPNKVTGKIIKYGNLENIASLCFDKLKKEYSKLKETDEDVDSRIQQLESYAIDGRLCADHQNESSLNDLANKVFNVQEAIRDLQSKNLNNSGTRKK